jgi:two-component system OmpR family sensor kinase
MFTSLKSRLILLLSVVIAAIALVQGGIAYRAALREADDMFDYHLQQMAASLMRGVRSAPDVGELPPLDDFDFIVQVWSQDGTRVFQSRSLDTLPDRAVLGFSEAPNGSNGQWRVYSLQTPTETIQVVQDMSARNRMARAMALRAIWPWLLLAPLLMVLAAWVVSHTLRPVARVRAAVAKRADYDLSPLPEQGLPDEVQPLVQEINSLFARVEKALSGQRQFIADAAHELRSPLTALKLQVQGLRRAGDEAQRERGLERVEAGIDRASRLVGQLLLLARQEAGERRQADTAESPPIDLAELARSEVTMAAERAAERQIDLGVDAPQPIPALVSEDGTRTVLGNLIDNALKYTPAGGRVDVRVAEQDGMALLEVADSGPGIAPELLPRVFDRFVRGEDHEAPGAGLGLAIVRTIVEQQQGRIELGRSELGGLAARVWLPLGQ